MTLHELFTPGEIVALKEDERCRFTAISNAIDAYNSNFDVLKTAYEALSSFNLFAQQPTQEFLLALLEKRSIALAILNCYHQPSEWQYCGSDSHHDYEKISCTNCGKELKHLSR